MKDWVFSILFLFMPAFENSIMKPAVSFLVSLLFLLFSVFWTEVRLPKDLFEHTDMIRFS